MFILKIDNSNITDWTDMKLGMMADSAGFTDSAKVILENKISGAQIINLTEDDLIDIGVYSRRERKALLSWVESKKQDSSIAGIYKPMQSEFGAMDLAPNSKNPRNLLFWEKDASEWNSSCVKCYFNSEIQVFTVPRTITVEEFSQRIKTVFGFAMTATDPTSKLDVTSDSQLQSLLNTKNTVCFNLKLKLPEMQSGYDVISSSSVPMVLVNGEGKLEFLNQAASKIFPKIAGERFSVIFNKKSKKLRSMVGSSFLAILPTENGQKTTSHVTVSVYPKPRCYVLTIIVLPMSMILDGMSLVQSITGVKMKNFHVK